MTVPVIPSFSRVPSRSSAPEMFSNDTDIFISELIGFQVAANESAAFVNEKAQEASDVVAAAVSASDAALSSAIAAMGFKNAAEAAVTGAETAKTQAQSAQAAASASATLASQWADSDGQVVSGRYSAKWWAEQAEAIATGGDVVTSVAGRTGVVVLTKADVGLSNVDNTTDANKPVSTATQTALNNKAATATTITAGNGLTGGGSLAANRTLTLGTPATLTTATTNAVTSESHTHAVTFPVTSVAGKTGSVTLAKADVGLGNVDNTADAAKSVASAATLTTARSINGTNFNGSAAIITANWGAARTLTIGSTGKSVNGSGSVAWSKAEIGTFPATLTTTAVSKTLAHFELCAVTESGLTITLPASPVAGDTVGISIVGNITNTMVGRNSQNIMGVAENMVIDTSNVTVTLCFVDVTRGWRII